MSSQTPIAPFTQRPLSKFPIHLGLGAKAIVEPLFGGDPSWYDKYTERHIRDGAEGRLVSMHTFTQSWDTWEMHPQGEEIVVCTKGSFELVQDHDGAELFVKLNEGEAVINGIGVWHTANIDNPCTALFITPGLGTQIRPR